MIRRTQLPESRRTSTPTPPDQGHTEAASMSQFESFLQIAETTHTELPELHLTTDMSREETGVSFLQTEEDSSSTFSGPPSLSSLKSKSLQTTVMLTQLEEDQAKTTFHPFMMLFLRHPK